MAKASSIKSSTSNHNANKSAFSQPNPQQVASPSLVEPSWVSSLSGYRFTERTQRILPDYNGSGHQTHAFVDCPHFLTNVYRDLPPQPVFQPLRAFFPIVALLMLSCTTVSPAQEAIAPNTNEITDENKNADITIEWLSGPFVARLGEMGTVPVPVGYLFADPVNTRRVLQALELRVTGSEIAMIRPANAKQDWYIVFDFADDGFVQDDEGESLQPSELLAALQDINEEENTERERRGWMPTKILDWKQQPEYDPNTNFFTWALRIERDGLVDINVNTRALGRHGVMIVNLVVSPEELNDVLPIYRAMIDQFDYREGHRYSEFRQGDKIARYGLSALITGTAATAFLKTGLLRRLLAPLIAALLATATAAKRWFGSKTRATPISPVPTRPSKTESSADG